MSDVFNIQSTVLQGIWPTTRLSTEDASEKEAVMGSGREPCNKRHGIRKMILSFAIEKILHNFGSLRFWACFRYVIPIWVTFSSYISAKHTTYLRQRGDGKVIYCWTYSWIPFNKIGDAILSTNVTSGYKCYKCNWLQCNYINVFNL